MHGNDRKRREKKTRNNTILYLSLFLSVSLCLSMSLALLLSLSLCCFTVVPVKARYETDTLSGAPGAAPASIARPPANALPTKPTTTNKQTNKQTNKM